jgi:dihydrofolate reductase
MISIIAAIDKKRGLGYQNKLLFRIPEDLKNFRRLTWGHPIIMGRKTYESIGKPLPGRTNIIITRNKDYKADGCWICHSFDSALKYARSKDKEETFIIGGGEIYKQAISIADRLYLTIVQTQIKADTFFPDYSQFNKIVAKKKFVGTKYNYQRLVLERG